MKNEFVADGGARLMDGYNAKNLEAPRAKFGEEWKKAGFMKRILLRYKMWQEASGQKEAHKPSPGTLW